MMPMFVAFIFLLSILSLLLRSVSLLLLSGDIEENPGPGKKPELNDIMFLLKPCSAEWNEIGIALGVDLNFRKNLYQLGDAVSPEYKLECILERWIQTSCSEVSWDFLIYVLHFELKGTAEIASKIKDYLLNNPGAKTKYKWNSCQRNDGITCVSVLVPQYVTECSEFFKRTIVDIPIVNEEEWIPKVGVDYYGELVLLETKRQEIVTRKKSLIAHDVKGRIQLLPSYTHQSTMRIGITDILHPNRSLILIDGPPAIGKSTLCRKLLNMWAKEQLPVEQQQYYLMAMYCSVTNDQVLQAETLAELMQVVYCYHDIEKVGKWFEQNEGNRLLIIFDDWREFSGTGLKGKQKPLAVEILKRKRFINSTVIVTTHCFGSAVPLGTRYLEIIGYDHENEIEKVIKGTLQQNSNKLLHALKFQSNLSSLYYFPLLCSLIMLEYQSNNCLPSRLTELYERLVIFTIRRHIKKQATLYKSEDNSRPVLHSLKELQLLPSVAAQFEVVSHFAYFSLESHQSNKLPNSLQDILLRTNDNGYLGLMVRNANFSFEFLHENIRDFLAAWWIAHNCIKDSKVFGENFDGHHFKLCLRFVAGLTNLKNQYFQSIMFNQRIDLQCSSTNGDCENLLSPDLFKFFLHLLYESKNEKLCKQFAQSFADHSICIKQLSTSFDLFDVLCLLHFFCKCDLTWNNVHLVYTEIFFVAFNDEFVEYKQVINCKTITISSDYPLTEKEVLEKLLKCAAPKKCNIKILPN